MQILLRHDEYKNAFISVDGLSTIFSKLSEKVNFQIQYQLIYCVWILTFDPTLAEQMNGFDYILYNILYILCNLICMFVGLMLFLFWQIF